MSGHVNCFVSGRERTVFTFEMFGDATDYLNRRKEANKSIDLCTVSFYFQNKPRMIKATDFLEWAEKKYSSQALPANMDAVESMKMMSKSTQLFLKGGI